MTSPRTLTVRTPEDVLALVLSVLGFQPADSVVLVTRTATASFHARADLPDEPAETAVVAEHLAEAAARNRAREAIVVTYSDDRALADAMTAALVRALGTRGIDVEFLVREHAGRWHRMGVPDDEEGTAYDLTGHPFVLESRFRDREIYRDRAELAASLRASEREIAATEAELVTAGVRLRGDHLTEEIAWVASRCWEEGPPSAADAARAALALTDREVRDGVWMAMERADAMRWRRLLKGLVRLTPTALVSEPAALLAFASWLSGDGALAWCAVDLARACEPDHTLASLVAQALEAAVPPSVWESPAAGQVGPQHG